MGSDITLDDQRPSTASEFEVSEEASTEDLVGIIREDNESVYGSTTETEGLRRVGDEETRRLQCAVEMVVTDQRVLFVAEIAGERIRASSFTWDRLASVSIEEGTAVFTAVDGMQWRFPLSDDRLRRHLRWVGEVRSRILSCRNDLELAVGEIQEDARNRNWEQAADRYRTIRDTVDQLVVAVQWTEPIPDQVLAPELTEMGRTLERTLAKVFVERGKSQLGLGRQLVENEAYDRAAPILEEAQTYYEQARDRLDAVERPDTFQFGEQRELQETLDRLDWELQAVGAEPIRLAHEATVQAKNTTDPIELLDHLETAYRRYEAVLDLEWGEDDRYFAGDPSVVRARRDNVGKQLLDCHRQFARDAWDAGVDHEKRGEIKAAIRQCDAAVIHLRRATDLANSIAPAEVGQLEERRERLEQTVRMLRETADPEEAAASPTESDDVDVAQQVKEEASLRDMDTHQEITLDATVEETDAPSGPTLDVDVDEAASESENETNDDEATEQIDDSDVDALRESILESEAGEDR